MKDFITALDPNYQLDKYHIKNNVAVFYLSLIHIQMCIRDSYEDYIKAKWNRGL